jgi:hypothetical protein
MMNNIKINPGDVYAVAIAELPAGDFLREDYTQKLNKFLQ